MIKWEMTRAQNLWTAYQASKRRNPYRQTMKVAHFRRNRTVLNHLMKHMPRLMATYIENHFWQMAHYEGTDTQLDCTDLRHRIYAMPVILPMEFNPYPPRLEEFTSMQVEYCDVRTYGFRDFIEGGAYYVKAAYSQKNKILLIDFSVVRTDLPLTYSEN